MLAGLFERRDFRDPELAEAQITVTEVRIGPDLKHAVAFVARLGRTDIDALLPALKRAVYPQPGGAGAAAEVHAGAFVPAGPRAGLRVEDRPVAASAGGGAGPGMRGCCRSPQPAVAAASSIGSCSATSA